MPGSSKKWNLRISWEFKYRERQHLMRRRDLIENNI